MKRDMNLVRNLLLEIEEWDNSSEEITLGKHNEGVTDREIYDHLEIMAEAGLIKGVRAAGYFHPERLTWSGHEFLDAVRSETTWKTTQEKIKTNFGSLSFEMVKALAIEITKSELKKHFPGLP